MLQWIKWRGYFTSLMNNIAYHIKSDSLFCSFNTYSEPTRRLDSILNTDYKIGEQNSDSL